MINNTFKKKNGYNYPLYLSFQPALCQIGLSMKIRNSNSNIKKKKITSVAALRVGARHDGSGTSHRSRTCTASLLKVRRDKNRGPNSSAERVVWTPSNPKSPVKIYLGLWSVDGKNADLEVKLYASCVSYS